MSLIGQAAREGFRDSVLKVIDRKIEAIDKDRSKSIIQTVLLLEELRNLKKEIEGLDTE